MKNILLIGLGRFGKHVASSLIPVGKQLWGGFGMQMV